MKSKPKSNNNKISKSSKTIPSTKYKSNNNQKIKSGIDIKNYNSDQNEKIENLQQKENIILIDEINNNSLVEFLLETGRTHQIRVTCNYLGHPILGDSIYGNDNIDTLHLYSYYLSFVHFEWGLHYKSKD